ncbi:hypothetical protein PFMALIP_04200 [Plasmodium falciparum MaliPS096_E11]|uniref:Uncharacterized protein n=1 Tax=Plasmodium falciparum MaliPS096_E11 TaxID=1036727 RepID=A0A024WMN2_PLAFA|nr:hypothetical protein PFMALIP_04200 [Plasmodium falciparum MaliPS096_E11]
MFTFQTSLKI